MCRSEYYEHEGHERPLLQQRTAQSPAVGTFGVEEHVNQREEEQSVASVCHGYAPWIAVYGQNAALSVVVIGRLIESHPAVSEYLVHRYACRYHLLSVNNGEFSLIIGCGVGAGVVFRIEFIQSHLERQPFLGNSAAAVLDIESSCGLTHSEVDHTLTGT